MPKTREGTTLIHHAQSCASSMIDDCGIFTWAIGTDTVYSDSLVAAFFGFSSADARRGMPLQDYLARMHPDDLPRVAEAIHHTMVSGQPFAEQYRICRPDGTQTEIMAFGSCFKNSNDEPSHYSGIILPCEQPSPRENAIIGHLLAAHDLARQEGRPELADKIIDAMVEFGWDDVAGDIAPLH